MKQITEDEQKSADLDMNLKGKIGHATMYLNFKFWMVKLTTEKCCTGTTPNL